MAKISIVDAFIHVTVKQEKRVDNKTLQAQQIIMSSINDDFKNKRFSSTIQLNRKEKKIFDNYVD